VLRGNLRLRAGDKAAAAACFDAALRILEKASVERRFDRL
jgi:hypothetical protein